MAQIFFSVRAEAYRGYAGENRAILIAPVFVAQLQGAQNAVEIDQSGNVPHLRFFGFYGGARIGDDVGAGAYSLRFQYRPLIRFVWLGALIMAIGGVTAVVGRRQRGAAWSALQTQAAQASALGSKGAAARGGGP